MLPMWVLALPIWLVVFIVLYALATLYVAIKYREVRKFLAGAFFVSSGTCWYLWMTGVSFPIVLPYAGTISVETPEISGQRAIVHFILFLLCFYFGFISKPKQKIYSRRAFGLNIDAPCGHSKAPTLAPPPSGWGFCFGGVTTNSFCEVGQW